MDEIVAGALIVSFAAWVTAHATLVAGLVAAKPRSRGLVALVLAPLAPYWGLRAGMTKRAIVWVLSAALYVVLRLVAARLAS